MQRMTTPNTYPYSDVKHQEDMAADNEEQEQYSELQHNMHQQQISMETTCSEYNTLHHNVAASNVQAPSYYSTLQQNTPANGSANNPDYSTLPGQVSRSTCNTDTNWNTKGQLT